MHLILPLFSKNLLYFPWVTGYSEEQQRIVCSEYVCILIVMPQEAYVQEYLINRHLEL